MADIPNALININGQLFDAKDARVSVFDRSYLYGDSLYEVARTYRGRFYRLDDHLDRLRHSAELCHMTLGQDLSQYKGEIEQTFRRWHEREGNRGREAYCRLVVSRGEGKIGFGLSALQTSTLFTIIVLPLEPPTPEQYRKGLNLRVVERLRNDPRAQTPEAKTGNYLNSLLAYLEGASEGADDALMCNAEGHLTEGTTFNIFYVNRGIIATPPLDIGVLHGITRHQVISLAHDLGYRVRETRFPRQRMYEAAEVFVSSSIKEVFPVTMLDGRAVGAGRPGPVTNALAQGFRRMVEAELGSAAA